MPTGTLYTPNEKMRAWLYAATTFEIKALTAIVGTSRAYLYKIARGERHASADLGGLIEDYARRLRTASNGRLPELNRADLTTACQVCPYFQRCQSRKG